MPVVDIAEMVERTQDELAPAYLIMAAAAVSLLATLCFKETTGRRSAFQQYGRISRFRNRERGRDRGAGAASRSGKKSIRGCAIPSALLGSTRTVPVATGSSSPSLHEADKVRRVDRICSDPTRHFRTFH